MNAITTYDVTRQRIDELHRQAATERLARQIAPRRALLTRSRDSLGSFLIGVGQRLRPSIADSLSGVPCDQMVVKETRLNLR